MAVMRMAGTAAAAAVATSGGPLPLTGGCASLYRSWWLVHSPGAEFVSTSHARKSTRSNVLPEATLCPP